MRVQFRRDVVADFDTARLRLIRNGEMQHIVFLKIRHVPFIHL